MDSKGYQPELFEEFEEPKRRLKFLRKRKFPQKFFTLRLSQEKLVSLTIGLVVLFLVSFSLGVERGKRISRIPQEAKASPPKLAARIQEPRIQESGVSKDEDLKKSTRDLQAKIEPERQKPGSSMLEEKTSQAKVPESYAIQVATYRKEERAQGELERLKLKGYNSFILTRNGYFEVCVGPYSNKVDAASSIDRLKKQYRDCYLRRL